METLSARYKYFHSTNTFAGNYIVLSMSVRGMNYGKQKINDAFNKHVPKSDYAKDEKDALLENLYHATKDKYRPEIWLNKAIIKTANAL